MDQRLGEINDYIELRKQLKLQFKDTANTADTAKIPVKVHLIRNSDGSGTFDSFVDSLFIDSLFSLVNSSFIDGNMWFVRCEPINYIDSTTLYELDEIEYDWVVSNYDALGMVNVYFSGDNPWSSPVGFMPPNPASVFMPYLISYNLWKTLAHELGHVLGLFHTFGNDISTELVIRN